ncbi:hypothetical protein ACFLX9_02090 [Chloroflexota bacterium]
MPIAALILSMVVLGFASYQTYLSRKSLDAARQTIDDARRSRALEILPRANWVIEVHWRLERWRGDLQKVVESLTTALKKRDDAILREVAAGGIESPEGLVPRFTYEHAPNWLVTILMTGVQYYYHCRAPTISLWDAEKEQPNYGLAEMLLSRCGECVQKISTLLGYIDDMVPVIYLESPASISEEKFLGR